MLNTKHNPKAPGRPSALDAAERERLLLEHLPEVRYIARRIHDRLPSHVPFDDLVHAGVLGLMDAIDKFDASKNTQLKSYAAFRIRGAILDSLRAMDWSPRSLRKHARKIEQAHCELSAALGRSPSETELADRLAMTLSEFQRLLGELRGLDLGSLQAGAGEDSSEENAGGYQPNSPDEDPFFVCLRSELQSLLAEAMNDLEEREKQVVALYYLEELTMTEVGAVLRLSESRVSQIHSAAMVRLRARIQDLMGPRASGGRASAATAGDTQWKKS